MTDTRVASDGKTVEAWFEGAWVRVGELTNSGAGIPVTRVVPFTPIRRPPVTERTEGWTRDGRSVAVPVDSNGQVTIDYPLLRKLLLDLGFTQFEEWPQ